MNSAIAEVKRLHRAHYLYCDTGHEKLLGEMGGFLSTALNVSPHCSDETSHEIDRQANILSSTDFCGGMTGSYMGHRKQ